MRNFSKIFDLIRAAAYLFLGFFILFNKQILSMLVPLFKVILGITLLLYGIYRLYQVYIKNFTKQHDDNT
jgi:hypothetical protein